jgi:hypothetical protein
MAKKKEAKPEQRRPYKAVRVPLDEHRILEQLAERGVRSIPQEVVRLIREEARRQGLAV